MISLDNIFEFTEMLHQFQQVKREVLVNGEDRNENDWEHSFQNTMLAWYIVATSDDLGLEIEKVLKYALAHDLVEVYAGDTPFREAGEEKEHREEEARQRLAKEFPEFSDLHEAIEGYEDQLDDESKFVYALDKIVPLINIYLDDGRSWQVSGVDLETLRKHKKDKFSDSPEVEQYYEQLMSIFSYQSETLFDTDAANS